MKYRALIVVLITALALSIAPSVLKAEDAAHYIEPTFRTNSDGPTIGSTVKSIIEVNGKYYRDSNGNGVLDDFENWELDIDARVSDLIPRMTIDEKLGLLVIEYRRDLGIYSDNTSLDGLLDETSGESTSIFDTSASYGTTQAITEIGLRRWVLRSNPQPSEIAKWNNALQQVAEGTSNGVPVVIVSNSRNENGEVTFGMNDASGVFSTWPGTLGLAAAAMGDIKAGGDAQLITDFAEISRAEWDASGIKKGYMYMADVVTDPRWQRTYGTLGERPDFVADAIARLVRGFQGSSDGLQADGVAMTVKHFPGGGARENGFDPHYSLGQWNPYPTEGSLEKYHLPPFQAAVDNHVSSIMPYYAKPYGAKSAPQTYDGMTLDLSEAVGFAFNKFFITELLRGKLGHTGYVNSDTGIIGNMAWGMQEYDAGVQAAYALNAGTDIISGPTNTAALKLAYLRSLSDDFKALDSNDRHVLTEERINEAAGRILKEEFMLGLFENPYRVPESADTVVNTARADERVYEAHQKSVVLLKNVNNTLPLSGDKMTGKKVYVNFYNKEGNTEEAVTALRDSFTARGMTLTTDYNEADYAILFLNPSSGQYFSATAGFLELDICDGKTVVDVDTTTGAPIDTTHEETTLKDAAEIATIAQAVHANGGLVIANVNITLPWMMGNVEPYVDALTVGFDTFTDAVIDVMTGVYSPTGVLPLTLPKNDDVISVDKDANCISHNDVAGYDKDQFLPAEMLDENGKGYAYKDSEGNYYESNFGLSITATPGTEPEPSGDITPEPGTEPEPSGDITPEPGTEPEPSEDITPEPGTEPEPSGDIGPRPGDEPEPSGDITPEPGTEPEPGNEPVDEPDTKVLDEAIQDIFGTDTDVQEITEGMIGATNSVSSLTDTQKSEVPEEQEIKLVLNTITFHAGGVYKFLIGRSDLLESGFNIGDKLFLHMLRAVQSAGDASVSSAISEEDYAFFDDNGNLIDSVPPTGDVNVGVNIDEAGSYIPAIAAEKTSDEDNSGDSGDSGDGGDNDSGDNNNVGPGSPSGGCDAGLSVMSLLAAVGLLVSASKKR